MTKHNGWKKQERVGGRFGKKSNITEIVKEIEDVDDFNKKVLELLKSNSKQCEFRSPSYLDFFIFLLLIFAVSFFVMMITPYLVPSVQQLTGNVLR